MPAATEPQNVTTHFDGFRPVGQCCLEIWERGLRRVATACR